MDMEQVKHENCSSLVGIHDVADYVILWLDEMGEDCSSLKLQKILYYVQSWHLAFYRTPLFTGKFEAWVHGPVNPSIYSRFANRTMYTSLQKDDVSNQNALESINSPDALHIKSILEAYGKFSGTQLEELTHEEEPWIKARAGYRSNQRCQVELDEGLIADYYSARLQ